MARLKVYRYTAHEPAVSAALGQHGHQKQVEALIATTSQAKAAEAIGVTLGAFRTYGGETMNPQSCVAALENPGVVIYAPLHSQNGPWVFKDGNRAH